MNIVQKPSPNFTLPKQKRDIWCVVIHSTATKALASPLEWLTLAESKVSAHYLIDVDGAVYQLVQEKDVAWHAGQSEWCGKPGVNAFSIGIELVNANDGIMLYTEEQLAACAELVADMSRRWDIKLGDVVGHLDVAPGRKTDPAAFPWEDFRMLLVEYGMRA